MGYDRAARKAYLDANRDRINAWRREYTRRKRATDPVWAEEERAKRRSREQGRGGRVRDRAKAKVYHARHQARKKGLPVPPLPTQ